MNRVELIGIVSKAPWEYLKNVTMFEVETSTLDHVTTHNLLSPTKFKDITNTLEEGDTVHIIGSLVYSQYMNNGLGAYKILIETINTSKYHRQSINK